MLPSAAILNRLHCSTGAREFRGDPPLGNALCESNSDALDSIRRENAVPVSFAPRHESISYSVIEVILMRCPFKILRSIIALIRVLVIYANLGASVFCRRRPKKGESDKSMHQGHELLEIMLKGNLGVA